MRRIIPAILVLFVALIGCKVKELADKANLSKDLDKRGPVDLMKQVANDKYDPPKDGKLTDAQVQMYLKVKQHEKEIASAAYQKADEHFKSADKAKNSFAGVMEGLQGMRNAAEFATADIRAAKDLGYNTQEYLWVKGQVLAVSATAFAEMTSNAMQASVESSQSQMRKAYDEAKDEQTKQMYKQMLDQYEKTAKEGKEVTAKVNVDPALAYNRQLLKKYDSELAGLATPDGATNQGLNDLQKKMQQVVDDAKKQP